jgi:small subunit ribosomal protein S4
MGDPKKNRKKYSKPAHPWQKERIDSEKELIKDYGLKNKSEIWRMKTHLDHYSNRVKGIISKSGSDDDEETTLLLTKLKSLGLIGQDAKLDDVLSLTIKNFLERRLQTLLFRKGLTRTINQARQFITHEHVMIGGRTISSPGYIVSNEEESKISFRGTSSLSNPDHPEISKESNPEAVKQEKMSSSKKDEKQEKSE